eukprot:6451779-Pyramimonas_sp.AAC.1
MQVKSGHYVRVAPDPLPEPEMVIFSDEMAAALGLSKMVGTKEFLRYFSGDMTAAPEMESWACLLYTSDAADDTPC